MKMPGFTAEASLYKTSERYYMVGTGAISAAQEGAIARDRAVVEPQIACCICGHWKGLGGRFKCFCSPDCVFA